MEKLKIKEDKVVIEIPKALGDRLRGEIDRVVSEWKGYQAPKFDLEDGKAKIVISESLGKKVFEHFTVGKKCRCKLCGIKISKSMRVAVPMVGQLIAQGDQRIDILGVCENCFTALQDVIQMCRGEIKWKKFKRMMFKTYNKIKEGR